MPILKWHLAHDEAIHDNSNGEEVRLVAVAAFVQHLRSHISQSTAIAQKSLVLRKVFADSKVYYLDVHVFVKHDVLWLYVLVNNLLLMDVF
jgi:hypothetical protein